MPKPYQKHHKLHTSSGTVVSSWITGRIFLREYQNTDLCLCQIQYNVHGEAKLCYYAVSRHKNSHD